MRDGEEDGLVGIDAAEDDGVLNADIGEREDIVEVAGRDVAGLDAAVAGGGGVGRSEGLCGLDLGLSGGGFGLPEGGGGPGGEQKDEEDGDDAGGETALGGSGGPGRLEEALKGFAEAHERELENALEAEEGAIDLAGFAPAEPGVGARVEDHGERLLLLERERIELGAEGVAVGLDDGGGEFGVAIEDGEDEFDGLRGREEELALHLDHDAAGRHIGGGSVDDDACGCNDFGGYRHLDANGLTTLLALPGDGGGDAEDDHVEEDPDEVHDDGAEVVGVVHAGEQVEREDHASAGKLEVAGDGGEQADDVHTEHEHEGLGDAGVEEGFVDDASLGGDVEAAELWVDEGEHGGKEDVGREDGLVDLVPEGVAVLALDAGVGHVGEHKVGEGVGEDGGPVAGDVGVSEQQVDEGGGEEDEAWKGVEEVRHGVEVAEALRGLEAFGEERVVGAHDLDHAAGPADALLDVPGEAFGGEAGGLRDVDVGGVPAVHLHAERGVGVLGDGFDGDAADLIERGAAEDGAGAAEEGGVPEVVAVLDDAVEELALVGDGAELVEVSLEGVGRVEVMRGLEHAELGIPEEPAERDLHEAARRDVVAVEDADVGRIEAGEGSIDVAGLGVFVIVARHVADAGLFGEGAELGTFAVVEDVDVELVGGPVDVHGGEGGVADDGQGLVIGGNEEVDGGPGVRVVGERDGGSAKGPEGLEVAEEEDDEGVGLRDDEQRDEEGVERRPSGTGVEEEFDGGGDAPVAVAEGGEHGDKHQRERDEIGARAAVHPDGDEDGEEAEDDLLRPGEFEDAGEAEEEDATGDEEDAEDAETEAFP